MYGRPVYCTSSTCTALHVSKWPFLMSIGTLSQSRPRLLPLEIDKARCEYFMSSTNWTQEVLTFSPLPIGYPAFHYRLRELISDTDCIPAYHQDASLPTMIPCVFVDRHIIHHSIGRTLGKCKLASDKS